jgi:hypothetical protein
VAGLTASPPESLPRPWGDAEPLRAERLERIAAMVDRHDHELRRVVRQRGSRRPEIVDGACKYAWMQLLTAEHVDVRPPLWEALAWLTSCAVRYARMLDEVEGRLAAPVEAMGGPA